VMDSGANVSITNTEIVAKFNLTPQRWERSFHIIFGNGGRFVCSHYADFGPILGRIAIVGETPDTLLRIAVLTDRGYEVRFLPEGQGVRIYSKGDLLFSGPQHPHSKLFHILPTTNPTCQLSPSAWTRPHKSPQRSLSTEPPLSSPQPETYCGSTRRWDILHEQPCTKPSCMEHRLVCQPISHQPKSTRRSRISTVYPAS